MTQPEVLSGWVKQVEATAVVGTEALVRTAGRVPPPSVHLFCEELDPPYVGFVECRPFYPGTDAATAIVALAALPKVLGASRVVVCWEHFDLCAALRDPNPHDLFGVVVVDADRDGHEVNWHPARLWLGPATGRDPAVELEWGPVTRERGGVLPESVATLLARWRAGHCDSGVEAVRVCVALEQAGYRMRWIARDVAASAPPWARALAPLMQ